jgi:hypothetical protein
MKQVDSEVEEEDKSARRPEKSSIINKIYVNEECFLGGESH